MMAPLKTLNIKVISVVGLLSLTTSTFAQGRLEEILVTAQKREQSAQSVGVTMSVVDASEIRSRNLQSLPDAANALVNVEVFEDFAGAGIPSWVIRGVGLQDFNANNTPTASIYVDESYQPSSVMGALGLFDIERIEVLKGPQGGLYGRNTSGGAVLVNSTRASIGENSGRFNLSYGSWDTGGFEGVTNLGLTDNSALRLSGRALSSGDAWQNSQVTGQHHGEKSLWDLRSWYSFQRDGNVSVDWKIQAGENNSEIGLGRSIGVYNNLGGICDALLQGYRDDKNCLSWSGLNLLVQGQENHNAVDLQAPDGSLTLSDPLNQNNSDYLSNLLIISKQFTNVEFSSISAYDVFSYGVDLDLDGSSGEYAHRLSTSDITVLSQEFRLVSNSASALSWLAGINISEERFEERRNFLFRDNYLVSQSIGFSLGNVDYDQDTSSRAVYGSIDYAFNAQWSLMASLRYTDEEKKYRNGNVYLPVEPPFYVFKGLTSDYELDNNFSGSLGVNFSLSDEVLLYASISSGFKSGGFYGGFPSYPEEVEPYQEEVITAYELGVKSEFNNRQLGLNGAVFYYDYKDVQGFITRPNRLTGTQIKVLSNQGDAVHYGAELEMFWLPVDALIINFGLAYLDASFEGEKAMSTDIQGNIVPISGNRPFAPRWSTSLDVNYSFSFSDEYKGRASLSYHYRSDRSGNQYSLAEEAIYNLSGYDLLNGRLEISNSQSGWSGALWAINILDESYLVNVKSDGLQGYIDMFGEPRSFGVSLEYQW